MKTTCYRQLLLLPIAILLIDLLQIEGSNTNKQRHKRTDKQEDFFSPVVFIPGVGASRLQAKLNKPSRVHYVCKLVSNWYDIWVNIHLLAPEFIDCTMDNLKLSYNLTSRTTDNSPGVQIRPTNFGSLDSVDYLDVMKFPKTDYLDTIITILETKNGYTRNVDMVAAPFDFRKAPNELAEFFTNLTWLIEGSYMKNNYKPVTLICHSLGCLNSVHLLNGKTQNWKDVYIRRLITLSAPWDGAFRAISSMLFGDNLGIPFISSEKLRALQSTFPSLMYLFPRTPTFAQDRVLVETKETNYTLSNLDDFFTATNMLEQMEMWYDTRSIAANLSAPDVELWCLYGSGIATPEKITFTSELKDRKYEQLMGDGDGTVNLESLRVCEKFSKTQVRSVYTRNFDNIDHVNILRASEVANFISSHIMNGDQINKQLDKCVL